MNHQVKHQPHIQSQLCHLIELNLEQKTPPHHAGKTEELGDSLPSPQICMPYNIVEMAGVHLIE